MVEDVFALPAFGQVAAFALLAGVKFGGNFPFVDIVVAVHTAAADVSELPFFFLQMTSKTRGGQVRPVEREVAFCMVFKSEKAGRETLHGVALRTVGAAEVGKFPIVIILVAIHA